MVNTKLGFLALVTLVPTVALAQLNVGDAVGTGDAEIRAKLESAGYTVEEIERNNGEIEVEAMLNGKEYELELSAEGNIREIELEDD